VAPGYPRAKLARYADAMAEIRAEDVWVFFNNDPQGAAVRDARTFTELLEERDVSVRGPSPERRETARRRG
jgi:uncharacterized protein YecE (DUF72 family)